MKNRSDNDNAKLVIMGVLDGNIKKANECYAMLTAEGVDMLKGMVSERRTAAQERGLTGCVSNMNKVEKYIEDKEKEAKKVLVKN